MGLCFYNHQFQEKFTYLVEMSNQHQVQKLNMNETIQYYLIPKFHMRFWKKIKEIYTIMKKHKD